MSSSADIRSYFWLALSSLSTILVGVVVSKLYAIKTGVSGVGVYGYLQSIIFVSSLFIGMGIHTTIIRFGSKLYKEKDFLSLAILYRRLSILPAILFLPMLCVLFFASRFGLITLSFTSQAFLVGMAALCFVFYNYFISVVNLKENLRELAVTLVLSNLVGASVNIFVAYQTSFSDMGVTCAIFLQYFGMSLIAYFFLRRFIFSDFHEHTKTRVHSDVLAKDVYNFSINFTASQICSVGATYVVPIYIFNTAGSTNVGIFKAATVIAISYFGLLLDILSKVYLPRVSRYDTGEEAFYTYVTKIFLICNMIAILVVMFGAAATPYLLRLFYTENFVAGTELTLLITLTNLPRFLSWVLAYAILSKARARVYLFSEISFSSVYIIATIVLMDRHELLGAGFAYLLSYSIYLLVCCYIMLRELKLVPNFYFVFVCVSSLVSSISLSLGHVFKFDQLFILGIGIMLLSFLTSVRGLTSMSKLRGVLR